MSIVLRRCTALIAMMLLVTTLLHAPAALAAVDEADLLPVDKAFALTAAAQGGDAIALHWAIADGYYLYRHRIKVAATRGATLGTLALPSGTPHDDEFFGKVETYRHRLAGRVPVGALSGDSVELQVSYQGCADLGVCYPPQTRTVRVAMAKSEAPASAAAPGPVDDAGFAALGDKLGGARPASLAGPVGTTSGRAAPLPDEQAFGFEAIAADGNTILLRFTPARGYYLYRDKTSLSLDADGIRAGAPRWPAGKPHRDEHFGNVVVFFDPIDVPLPLDRTRADAQKVTLTASFQGCQDDGICYPVMTRKVVVSLPAGEAGSIPAAASATADDATRAAHAANGADAEPGAERDAPASTASESTAANASDTATPPSSASGTAAASTDLAEDSRIAASLSGPGRWLALFGFFGAGLLLAFTPCVLPMIPILSGLIAGSGTPIGTRRALWLSLVYVVANALVFTAAGVIAALVGANLQTAFQTPWVLVLFSLVFIALALSSFGLYEIQLPAALRAKLGGVSDKQRGGSLAGVAAMGALSALIVGPCVAPPLAAAVLYISQSHDPVFGGLALFVLAMGMGAPLLVFGAAAGRGMPTSGPWMTAVQRVFGFVFLGLAVWMLSRIVPGAVTLALFGGLALAAAAWAWNGARSEDPRLALFARFAGMVLAVVGAAEMFGAMANGSDPLRPLAGLATGQGEAHAAIAFRKIKTTQDLDREIAAAKANGQSLMLDFYADWCVSCKEMERDTFTDPDVRAALAEVVLLKADVTAADDADFALMQRFEILGPPGTLFFVDGREVRASRLVGFEQAAPFAARVRRAGGGR